MPSILRLRDTFTFKMIGLTGIRKIKHRVQWTRHQGLRERKRNLLKLVKTGLGRGSGKTGTLRTQMEKLNETP